MNISTYARYHQRGILSPKEGTKSKKYGHSTATPKYYDSKAKSRVSLLGQLSSIVNRKEEEFTQPLNKTIKYVNLKDTATKKISDNYNKPSTNQINLHNFKNMTTNMKFISEIDKFYRQKKSLKHSSTVKCLHDFDTSEKRVVPHSHSKYLYGNANFKNSPDCTDTSPTAYNSKVTIFSPESTKAETKKTKPIVIQSKVQKSRLDIQRLQNHSQENKRTNL